MTLTVAIATDTGVWMASDRIQGDFNYVEIATPKIYRLEGEGITFLAGFAGSPRVVQEILRLEPPPLDEGQTLESWLTCWCDTVYERCRDMGLMREATEGADEPYLAGYTDMVIGVQGRVFVVAEDLQWTEPKAGWAATGGAAPTWAGAWEAHRENIPEVDAARLAWRIAQRHHRIGDLADELTLGHDTADAA